MRDKDNPREDPNVIALAQLATWVDAEGCISIKRCSSSQERRLYGPYYSVVVSVGNTNLKVSEFFESVFPSRTTVRPERAKWKKSYHWEVSGKEAAQFLRMIRQHLLLKGEQADIIFEYMTGFRRGYQSRLTVEERQRREVLYLRLRELNRKGPPAETERGDPI